MKTCTKCKVEQPTSEFGKNKASKDGLQYNCKTCVRARREFERELSRRQNMRLVGVVEGGKDCSNLMLRPHIGYIWYRTDGTPAYVGITSMDLKERNKDHRLRSDWCDASVVDPVGHVTEFANRYEAEDWEKLRIEAFIAEGATLFNKRHNPLYK